MKCLVVSVEQKEWRLFATVPLRALLSAPRSQVGWGLWTEIPITEIISS